MTAHLRHVEVNSCYGLTLRGAPTVIAHTGQDRQRQIEIRWRCTRLDMTRTEAVELWERLGAALEIELDTRRAS